MLLEHVGHRILLHMIYALGAYAPGAVGPGEAAPISSMSIISGQNLTEAFDIFSVLLMSLFSFHLGFRVIRRYT